VVVFNPMFKKPGIESRVFLQLTISNGFAGLELLLRLASRFFCSGCFSFLPVGLTYTES
jgi:hypothetical protein